MLRQVVLAGVGQAALLAARRRGAAARRAARACFGFSTKSIDAAVLVEPDDAERRRLVAARRARRRWSRRRSLSRCVLSMSAEVHAVELVAGEDQHVAGAVGVEVAEVLPDGVGGALVPVGRLVGLLGGQHLDEAAAERVELVGVGDVPVQADATGTASGRRCGCRPLLMQLLMGMSMRRYLPATGTAGLLRSLVSGYRPAPRPPPRMKPRTSCMRGVLRDVCCMGADRLRPPSLLHASVQGVQHGRDRASLYASQARGVPAISTSTMPAMQGATARPHARPPRPERPVRDFRRLPRGGTQGASTELGVKLRRNRGVGRRRKRGSRAGPCGWRCLRPTAPPVCFMRRPIICLHAPSISPLPIGSPRAAAARSSAGPGARRSSSAPPAAAASRPARSGTHSALACAYSHSPP